MTTPQIKAFKNPSDEVVEAWEQYISNQGTFVEGRLFQGERISLCYLLTGEWVVTIKTLPPILLHFDQQSHSSVTPFAYRALFENEQNAQEHYQCLLRVLQHRN